MSQKRDDRYESAQLMREALNSAATGSLGEAATVLTATGTTTRANTVTPVTASGTQVAGGHTRGVASEAQTMLADEGTRVRAGTVAPETATMVRPATHDRKSSRTWIAAALIALVIGGSAVGFWVYRARKSQGTATATPTPTESPVVQATPAPINEKVGQTATPAEKDGTRTPAKSEQPKHTARQTENAAPKPTPASDSLNRDLLRHPSPPPTDQYRPPPDTPRPRPQEPRVQTFPNGTRMERRPDGTTVITFPNGATRVIPPGVPPPNRRRPRPNSTPPQF